MYEHFYTDANDEKGENRIVPGAKFDLSALLTGVTTMEFTLPVLNSTSYMMKELSKCMILVIFTLK